MKKSLTGKMAGDDAFTLLCRAMLGVECVRELRFDRFRRWRFDYALPAYRIALEVEGGAWTGGRHTRPQGFINDMEKYNAAALQGWRVLRVIPSKLYSRETLDMLGEAIKSGKTMVCLDNG